jgi:hypothetical protein
MKIQHRHEECHYHVIFEEKLRQIPNLFYLYEKILPLNHILFIKTTQISKGPKHQEKKRRRKTAS